MIIIITGIPGSGKTLFAVDLLYKKAQKNNELPLAERQNIQADITDLNIAGIEDNPPVDWREAPPKSVLCYDEAQTYPQFKEGRGLSPYKFVEDLTLHRKGGYELIYITQDIKRLHTNITEMCQIHYHVVRPFGAKASTIYQFRGHERNPNSETAKARAENKFLFKYDKKLFDLYKSSQVDDGIKFKLPPKLLAFAMLPLLLFAFAGYMFFSSDTQKFVKGASDTVDSSDTDKIVQEIIEKNDKKVSSVDVSIDTVSQNEDFNNSEIEKVLNEVEVKNIKGIVHNLNNCIAFDDTGRYIDMPYDTCVKMAHDINGYKASFLPAVTDVGGQNVHSDL